MINSDQSNSEMTSIWLDSHVHVYEVVDVESLFDNALSNFEKLAKESNSVANEFVIVVTEGINEGAAERLRTAQLQRWNIEQGTESGLLIATNLSSNGKLLIVLAQQLVSDEGIEALVIGVERQEYLPRRPLLELLRKLDHGITILPWGVGKWLGERGKHISHVIDGYTSGAPIFVGDIPARNKVFGGGSQLQLSKQMNLPTLRGTDNLPLKGDEVRVGQFCTQLMIATQQFKQSPLTSLLETLKDDASMAGITQRGAFLSLVSNVKSQLQLRL